mmetsp:Transcript_14883/g.25353  ORF Transcript_14883/g.25353 Transcript_14883/m.25353 type:complete len:133 (+) Transcript_14883:251-649(+)
MYFKKKSNGDKAETAADLASPKREALEAQPQDQGVGSVRKVEIVGAAELEEGGMMELKLSETKNDKILVAKYKGKLYATGAFCSHFGAPLVNGVLFDDKVLCPWHAAGFSVQTGESESAPGLDGLPSYPVFE